MPSPEAMDRAAREIEAVMSSWLGLPIRATLGLALCPDCPHLKVAHVYFVDVGYQCQAPDCACVRQ